MTPGGLKPTAIHVRELCARARIRRAHCLENVINGRGVTITLSLIAQNMYRGLLHKYMIVSFINLYVGESEITMRIINHIIH